MSAIVERGISAAAPGRRMALVLKHDTNPNVFRALRICVADADAPATLKILPPDMDVGQEVTLTFPLGGVYWEPMGCKVVWSTGSTANVIVHGVP